MIRLRNCWQGEVYTGEWSKFSSKMDSDKLRALNLDEQDDSEFVMDIVEFMHIFECMIVYKANPYYV